MQSKITMESWSLASQPERLLWAICHSESTADGLLPTRTASGSGVFCSEPPCRDPEMCTKTCLTHREGHQGASYRHCMRSYAKYRDSIPPFSVLYGVTIDPSSLRTGAQAPDCQFSSVPSIPCGHGYFAAASSSMSTPSPGYAAAHDPLSKQRRRRRWKIGRGGLLLHTGPIRAKPHHALLELMQAKTWKDFLECRLIPCPAAARRRIKAPNFVPVPNNGYATVCM